jgi:hypothetical protein
MKMVRRTALRLAALVLGILPAQHASSGLPHTDAPALSVHECSYGTALREGRRESIQRIEIGIISRTRPGTAYQVQCFFLQRGKDGGSPSIHDTALFDVVDPHGTYRVAALPIKLGTISQHKSGKNSKNSTASLTTKNPIANHPREGFLVRIMRDGEMLREHASSHSLDRLATEDPGFFSKAAECKKARHLDASDLIVR